MNRFEDKQLERATLVSLFSCIGATEITKRLAQWLTVDDFTDDYCREAWRLARRCADEGRAVSLLNVFAAASEEGTKFDTSRLINTHSLANEAADTETMAATVHALGRKRRLLNSLEDCLMDLSRDEERTADEAVMELTKIIDDFHTTADRSVEEWSETTAELMAVTQAKANGELPRGVPTGFRLIDSKGGLEPGELMVVAGRNSNGKTSLALCMALEAARHGAKVGIFSLEMTNLQLTTRLASMLTGIDGTRLKRGQLYEVGDVDEWRLLTGLDQSLQIYFDKRRATDADLLIANIKGMVATYGVRVVVIDYLQLLRSRERDRVQQIGGIAHRLEALSTQLGITIILLSQLRRNSPGDPTPKLEELKESGDIADAADSIYLVYRPERHGPDARYPGEWAGYSTEGTALLMCVKNRNGELNGDELLAFEAATTRFHEREDFERIELAPAPYTFDKYTPY